MPKSHNFYLCYADPGTFLQGFDLEDHMEG